MEKSPVLESLEKKEQVKFSPEMKFPAKSEVKEQVSEKQGGEVQQGDAAPSIPLAKQIDLASLTEGSQVHYVIPNSWPKNVRGQRRAALAAYVYRDSRNAPTGLLNLILFLNGPADTGDMGGPRTRCIAFEAGVKFSEQGEAGCWTWAK